MCVLCVCIYIYSDGQKLRTKNPFSIFFGAVSKHELRTTGHYRPAPARLSLYMLYGESVGEACA